jgi:ribosomal 50S subunit-recycling heat shock protein
VLSRRNLLQGTVALLIVRDALAQGRVERGVYRVRGDVRVNGETAREGAQVRAGDSITTGAEGEMVFVVNRDAMLVRRSSNVSLLADGLRAVTGAVLSVFASGQRKQIVTGTAVIGIRGTGVYVEAGPDRSYVCACYGEVTLEPVGDPAARETVRTSHHEQPRYVMATGAPQMIMRAPVLNHTDAELILLESLVGRQPPFIGQGVRPY